MEQDLQSEKAKAESTLPEACSTEADSNKNKDKKVHQTNIALNGGWEVGEGVTYSAQPQKKKKSKHSKPIGQDKQDLRHSTLSS